MKLSDIEMCIDELNDLKSFADKENYNITSAVNKRLLKILPVLIDERARLMLEDVDVVAPQMKIIRLDGPMDIPSDKDIDLDNITYLLNKCLQELTQNDKKIIDFGYLNTREAYIKYNS